MLTVIIALTFAGILAGLVQYFVDFKKLTTPAAQSFETGTVKKIFEFLMGYWQIPAYIIIGLAGAALVPMLHAIIPLKGLEAVKGYVECIPDPAANKNCHLDNWTILVLLGYGIVLGYSAVRALKSVGTMLLGRMAAIQQGQQVNAATMSARLENLEKRITSTGGQADYLAMQPVVNLYDDDPGPGVSTASSAASNCVQNPPPWNGKPFRPAESIKKILQQINLLAPDRSKISDGIIGDMNHQLSTSDHNPWILDGTMGVVTAIDITHDPANKCNCSILADALQNGKDSRIKYVIWNRQIMSSTNTPWTWRPYSGANPHDKHIHISVNCDKPSYDSTAIWAIQTS